MRLIDKGGRGRVNQARLMRALLAGTAISAAMPLPAVAQTWVGGTAGAPSDYNTAGNWSTNLVPNITQTASFGASHGTRSHSSSSTLRIRGSAMNRRTMALPVSALSTAVSDIPW